MGAACFSDSVQRLGEFQRRESFRITQYSFVSFGFGMVSAPPAPEQRADRVSGSGVHPTRERSLRRKSPE